MKLDKSQRQQLREAIISAYRNESNLKIMLSDELDVRLNNIVDGGDYNTIVFNLVNWADEQGRLEELISAAYRRNPRNEDFCNFLNTNIKKIISFDECLIKVNLWHELFSLLEKLPKLDLLEELCLQILPPYSTDNLSEDIKDIKNNDLVCDFRIFLLFKLLIRDYPRHQDGTPSILMFAQKLSEAEEVSNSKISNNLKEWIDEFAIIHNISRKKVKDSRSLKANKTLEVYLIIIVAPTSESDKFRLNAYLEFPQAHTIPIDLPDETSETGVVVSFKKTANQQTQKAIIDLISKGEICLSRKQKELGYETYSLTIEFFLPLGYLHKDIENFKILKLEEWLPMGTYYKVVVRSYDRVTDFSLWNRFLECWARIRKLLQESNNQQEDHIEFWQEVCDSRRIPSLSPNTIALKLAGSLPESEEIRTNLFRGLFREIVLQGIPVAIWTRCSEIPGVDVVAELDKLLDLKSFNNPESLLDKIKQKRYEIKYKDEPQQFLGYHLGILYESDRWREITWQEIPINITLSE